MKIGIDARMMGPGNSGLGRYVEQLVKHLLEVDQTNQYVLFVRDESQMSDLPCRQAGVNCQTCLAGRQVSNVKVVVADIPWYGWEEQIQFPAIIKKETIDLMHFSHWNVPLLYRGPYVVTVHDLIMWHYPRVEASTHGPLVYWIKDFFSRVVVRHAVKKAKYVFVTSEFTKQDVHQTLGVPLQKMTTTYQAPFNNFCHSERNPSDPGGVEGDVEESFRPCVVPMKDSSAPFAFPTRSGSLTSARFAGASARRVGMTKGAEVAHQLEKYGITKPYALYVGNAYPHKNLERLLQAWKIIEEKYGDAYQLALVGKESFFYTKLHQQVSRSAGQQVIFTGFVSDDELASLYAGARLYVFPSLYEGFGLPPLEAMTYGIPVVSSNASCLPEVLGEAALYFDPENTEQMAQVIERGLVDESIRFSLKQAQKQELQRYSWKRLAEQTLLCYTQAMQTKS